MNCYTNQISVQYIRLLCLVGTGTLNLVLHLLISVHLQVIVIVIFTSSIIIFKITYYCDETITHPIDTIGQSPFLRSVFEDFWIYHPEPAPEGYPLDCPNPKIFCG